MKYPPPIDMAALHKAAYYGDVPTVEFFLRVGYNPHSEIIGGGITPLHLAVSRGNKNKDIVWLLLKAGADIHAKDARGFTPFEIAKKQNSVVLIDLMSKAEALRESKKKPERKSQVKVIKKSEE